MNTDVKLNRRPHPRRNANLLSALSFCYTFPIFMEGYKKDLNVEDLYKALPEHTSNTLGDRLQIFWNKELKHATKYNKKPSLAKALARTFALEFMFYGFILTVLNIFVKLVYPLCLAQLITYFAPHPSNKTIVTETEAYLYGLGVVLSSLFQVMMLHPYTMEVQHIMMKIRIACCSLIYRKSLRLSCTALRNTTPGHVVNLISNDINRFDIYLTYTHYLWVGPLQTIVVTYLMYLEVGISAVIGVIFLLLLVPLYVILGKASAIYRLKIALRTDERVSLMNEIINGIQVIKMYTWEKPFAKLVSDTRRAEISAIRIASYIRGIVISFPMFITRTALFITILAYVLFGNKINARQVFTVTAFLNILRGPMVSFFSQGIAGLGETKVAIIRLTEFLLYDETDTKSCQENNVQIKNNIKEVISIKNGNTKWIESLSDNTLSDINIHINRGSLIAIIGPIGSGKTSLLHVILRELPLMEGELFVNGCSSYASQEPWLFSGSVQQNILFGRKLDKNRYETIIRNCALEKDLQLLPYGDQTIVGDRGVSLSGGQRARIHLARAVYAKADIYLLDDPLSAVDARVGKQIFDNCIKDYLKNKTVILITHQLQYLKDVDYIYILKKGAVQCEGSLNNLQNCESEFANLLKTENSESEEELIMSRHTSLKKHVNDLTEVNRAPQVEEEKSIGSVSNYVYKAYFLAGGNYFVLCCVVFLFILAQAFGTLSDYFITFWVNHEPNPVNKSGIYNNWFSSVVRLLDKSSFSTGTAILIYSLLTVAVIAFSFTRSFVFFEICMKTSRNLHYKMLNSILRGTMRFFNTNTAGRILNRFSKDIGAVDERLPAAIVDSAQMGISLIASIIVISSVNPWMIIPAVIIGTISYYLMIFYLKTSRNIKRLEGITRSPVFAHLNASLQGLTSIRAYKAEKILEKEFDSHQDLHSSSWYTFLATSTAFGYWIDIMCVTYVAIVTFSVFMLNTESYAGNVGLIITQSLAMTGVLQWGMKQLAEFETNMTSVERVLEYTSIDKEPPLESPPSLLLKLWPSKGEIKFVDLSLYYFPNDPPVLANLNFTINPSEKIGIVGRTGGGKSSLIAALFRLADTKGSIFIDGIDTKSVGLHDLRSKLSIIPQQPVLFSGTIRKNLDPFDEYGDDLLWNALEEVELKLVVKDMANGLDSLLLEGGTNFSVGQRQLFCLARGIIRNNKILILDEATANVDPQTDELIQSIIQEKFVNCTVITIAHRLHSVMNSDKVLVMDKGITVEFDTPYVLLQNTNGYFYKIVHQTGRGEEEHLTRIAKETYENRQDNKNIQYENCL